MLKTTYEQINKMLAMVEDAIGYIQNFSEEEYCQLMGRLGADLKYTMQAVNQELLDSAKVNFCDLEQLDESLKNSECKEELIKRCISWKGETARILKRRYDAENVWDERFIRLMDYIQYVDFDTIVENTKDSLKERSSEEINYLCIYYQCFSELWGTLDISNDQYDVILNRVTALKEHREDFLWLYSQLGDWRSRLVLVSMLYSWITFDRSWITGMKEANFADYYDLDLLECDEEEVMVDLGAWRGDSALEFIQTYGKYKRIYCYEIDKISMEAAKNNLNCYPDIEYRNKGAGDKNETGYIDIKVPGSSGNRIAEHETGTKIQIVRLDDDIDEKITLIKMDIEGAEQAALSGCSRHIREEKPKLLISVYHNNEDIWKIPRIVRDMNPNYQLYLRSNGNQWGPSEIVLFAIDRQ